jgi:hypothetical protein
MRFYQKDSEIGLDHFSGLVSLEKKMFLEYERFLVIHVDFAIRRR